MNDKMILMRIFQNISIKHKLTLIIMLISGIALLIAISVIIVYDQRTFKRNMVRDQNILSEIIADNCTAALTFNNEDDATETLAALKAEKHIVSAAVYNQDNRVFAMYFRPGIGSSDSLFPPKKEGSWFEKNHLNVFRPVILDGDVIGTVYIKSDLREIYSRLKWYLKTIFIVLFMSFLAVYLITSRLQRIVSVPILHLAKVARIVYHKNDYSVRAEKYGKDELGFLTERFNQMLQQIQERDVAMQKAHDALARRDKELRKELRVRKRAENQIKASLKEKEVLLKEIHHRVKNNLQVVSSLLNLQSGQIRDREALEMFNESQNRIRSMALIHESLYQSQDLASIDFSEYIYGLANYLNRSYGSSSNSVKMDVDVRDISLSIDKAIPCGLLINELVTNSLKHAFPTSLERTDGGHNVIIIKFYSDEDSGYTLIVQDNGVGLPKNFSLEDSETLGLQLVTTLVKQLKGSLDFQSNNGTEFKIVFGEAYHLNEDKKNG